MQKIESGLTAKDVDYIVKFTNKTIKKINGLIEHEINTAGNCLIQAFAGSIAETVYSHFGELAAQNMRDFKTVPYSAIKLKGE